MFKGEPINSLNNHIYTYIHIFVFSNVWQVSHF